MHVGILGSGIVAQTLGAGFLTHGHAVLLGTRDPTKLADWHRAHPQARLGSVADAAAFGELVVLAVKGDAALDVLRTAGPALAGKVVMDTTNPIAASLPVNGVLRFFTPLDDSLMGRLQQAHPGARFVKAFNSVSNARMVNPRFAAGRPTMFICGNDAEAKEVRVGDPGPGRRRSRPGYRAAVHPVVHSRLPQERMDPRVQGAPHVGDES